MGMLERRFGLREHGTTVRTEVEAGLTTFLTMAYILAVNPQILGEAGVPVEGALFATAVSAAVGSILMGLLANYPFALAPGMGLNAYFTYSVVVGMGVPWQTALGAVFLSGVAFVLLTLARVRELVVRAIPLGLKLAVGAGIGLFIAFIGFRNAGVVAASPATLVTLGDVTALPTLLALGGLVLTAALMARGWKSAIIAGIVATAAAAFLAGVAQPPARLVAVPDAGSTWLAMDVRGALGMGLLQVVFVFLFVDLFDSVGTLVGLGRQAGYLTPAGDLPRARRALMADAVATTAGAALGTSTVTAYVESATGVAEGGRTGLTAVVVGLLFALATFFSPLAAAVPAVATAPALVIVGSLMLKSALAVEWDDATEAVPAFVTLVAMPLTYSIANGLALGFIAYPLVKALAGRAREVSPLVYVLAALFVLRFVYIGAG
ncbi:MAG TPA: NCS2 family permease [Longimicrobiaceae bacterium]|nr:NCS2 family permease [Longimicrobiaceae bacterium]